MTNTTTTTPNHGQQKDWISSPTEFAVILEGRTGKQIADFASPHLSEQECLANFKLGIAAPKLLDALGSLLKATAGHARHFEEYKYAAAALAEATDDSIGRVA